MQKINFTFLLLCISLSFFSCAQKPSVRFVLETNLAEHETAIKSQVIETLKVRLERAGFGNSVVAPVKNSSHIVVEVNSDGDLENVRELLLRKGELKIIPVFKVGDSEIQTFVDTLKARKGRNMEDYLSKPILDASDYGLYLSQGHDTASIMKELKSDGILSLLPKSARCVWQKPTKFFRQWKLTVLDGSKAKQFRNIVEANAYYNSRSIVNFKLNKSEARIWSEMTKDNIGGQLAMFIDDKFISAPAVQQRIMGGNCDISGNFTFEECKTIANLLESKPLPIRLELLSESIIENK